MSLWNWFELEAFKGYFDKLDAINKLTFIVGINFEIKDMHID